MLEGKVAIITGASRGIGAAAARVFADAGASVVLASRDEPALAAIAQEIRGGGGEALVVGTDVGDPDAVKRLVERTVEEFGRLDVAFNNAGAGHPPAPLADVGIEDFDEALSLNLRGVFLCMKHEIPAMLESGGGAIVNNSSTAGLGGPPGMSGYAAAKHGVIGLTKAAAIDYGPRNIRVNALAPGPILTERLLALGQETLNHIAGMVPMRRLGEPAEVARTAAWLCSDQASYLTGVTIPVDGGRLAM